MLITAHLKWHGSSSCFPHKVPLIRKVVGFAVDEKYICCFFMRDSEQAWRLIQSEMWKKNKELVLHFNGYCPDMEWRCPVTCGCAWRWNCSFDCNSSHYICFKLFSQSISVWFHQLVLWNGDHSRLCTLIIVQKQQATFRSETCATMRKSIFWMWVWWRIPDSKSGIWTISTMNKNTVYSKLLFRSCSIVVQLPLSNLPCPQVLGKWKFSPHQYSFSNSFHI